MALDKLTKQLLNDFSKSQPALNKTGVPFPDSALKLGDLLESATSSIKSKSVKYSVASNGGAVGTYSLPLTLPAGAVLTRFYTNETIALDDDGNSSTIELFVGATSVKGAALITDYAGVQDQSAVTLDEPITVPQLLSAGGALSLEIAVDALIDGELVLTVEYIDPTSINS